MLLVENRRRTICCVPCARVPQRESPKARLRPGPRRSLLSEVWALDRCDIDWDRRAVTVVGKGRREREVYFGSSAALWLRRYIDGRIEEVPALFVTEVQQRQGNAHVSRR